MLIMSVVYISACNCFDHADECRYDARVDALALSLNATGQKSGGGVCIGCRDNTAGEYKGQQYKQIL